MKINHLVKIPSDLSLNSFLTANELNNQIQRTKEEFEQHFGNYFLRMSSVAYG